MATNRKQFRANKNIVAPPSGDTVVLKGHYLDDHDRSLWHKAENQKVPDGTIVRFGSMVESTLASTREHKWKKLSIMSTPDEHLHDNLEAVFSEEYSPDGVNKWTLADRLRENDVWSFEQIVSGDPPARTTFTNEPVPVDKLLLFFANNDTNVVRDWLEASKAQLAEPVAVEPEPLEENEDGDTSSTGE